MDEQQGSWLRYLACSTLPLPSDRRGMRAYLRSLQDAQPAGLAATLVECEVGGHRSALWHQGYGTVLHLAWLHRLLGNVKLLARRAA